MKRKGASVNAPASKPSLRETVRAELEHHPRTDTSTLIKTMKAGQWTVTWTDLHDIPEIWRNRTPITPTFITDLLTGIAKHQRPQRILDPWSGIGSTLIPVVDGTKAPHATGISIVPAETAIAQAMTGGLPIKWINDRPTTALDGLGEYDLIVSGPPVGLENDTITLHDDGKDVRLRGGATYTIVLKSTEHLTKDGCAMFVLPDGFLFHEDTAPVRDALARHGIHVNSVIALPAMTFAPATTIALNIVIFSRNKTTDVFVCQLSPTTDQHVLLKNLVGRTPSAAPDAGRLVPLQGFTSFQSLQRNEEIERLAQRSGLRPIPFSDVIREAVLGKQTEDGGFADRPNCVYLPLIGTSPAVTKAADLVIKGHNYIQLSLDPQTVDAEYFAGFLNTPLGRMVRDSMLGGTFIPKLSKRTIMHGTVYIPPPEAQLSTVRTNRELQDLGLQLDRLRRDLWQRPTDAPKVQKALRKLNHKEGFESWLESLPFPLASILWRYEAAANPEHKVTHLLNAFEAFAQFLGTIMISAFRSNNEYFREHRSEWFDQGKDNPHSLSRSSFGEWVVRCQRLAKTTRRLLDDKEQRQFVMDLYGVDAERLSGLVDRRIYATLDTACRYRNDWKGHSGIAGPTVQEKRLVVLQEELTRLRAALGGTFEDWWLIRARPAELTPHGTRYVAEKLIGTRQIFKQEDIWTADAMYTDEIYCYDTTRQRPLQLVHFVRMLKAPETQEIACYYYNRLEKGKVRLVSYHFEAAEELVEQDPHLLQLIEEAESD